MGATLTSPSYTPEYLKLSKYPDIKWLTTIFTDSTHAIFSISSKRLREKKSAQGSRHTATEKMEPETLAIKGG
jgi:hypothetical protein